jgi:hypothetical protein
MRGLSWVHVYTGVYAAVPPLSRGHEVCPEDLTTDASNCFHNAQLAGLIDD